MTEINKLLEKGFISESFLQEEVRSEYTVSSTIKKTWAIQLDLMRILMDVCQQHKLKIWAIGGTLLGAVRHHGFIPWDDDMDFIMPRNDFDKLMKLGPLVFPKPYYLQSPFSPSKKNEEIYFPAARLCNSNTFLDHQVCDIKDIRWNSGIFIDIFVLDGVPSSSLILKSRFQIINYYWIVLHAYSLNINKHWLARLTHNVLHFPLLHCSSYSISRRMHRIARRTHYDHSDIIVSLIATPYALERNIFNKKDFDDAVLLPFENMTIPVPIGFDNVLKVSFGNYMQFPPLEKRGVWHHFTVNPDMPYTIILNQYLEAQQNR